MCCVAPGALSPQQLCFFRFYLGRVHFQEGAIPIAHPDEGMLNDLVKSELPCFHTGAEGPGIEGAPLVPDLGDGKQAAPHRDRTRKDPDDQSVSSDHEPETDCLDQMRRPASSG